MRDDNDGYNRISTWQGVKLKQNKRDEIDRLTKEWEAENGKVKPVGIIVRTAKELDDMVKPKNYRITSEIRGDNDARRENRSKGRSSYKG